MNQPEDVEIVLGYGSRYKFHSGTLARHSPLFADMLTEPKAARLSPRARNAGIKIRWMIELTWLPCDKYPAGRFELVALTNTGERADNRKGLIANENGLIQQAQKCFEYYESIFYAFYGRELVINNSTMIAALEHCYELLEKSDYLGCTSFISKPIEVALRNYGQDLFRAIANTPHVWVEMAVRIRSDFLFYECIIHLVGNWRGLQQAHSNLRERLSRIPGLVALIERHHTQLLDRCQKLELGILSLYPSGVLPHVEHGEPVKREVYAKDVLCWLALTFFREWVTQRLIKDEGHNATDCGYALYKQLGAGADMDMDRELLKEFQEGKFPMTSKALRVMEHHLKEIKNCVKEVVEEYGILKSNCQLHVQKFPVPYLTCIVLDKREYPWESHVQAAQGGVERKKKYKPGGNDIAMQNLDSARKSKEMSGAVMEEGEERKRGKEEEEGGEGEKGEEGEERDQGDDEFESDDMESGKERGKRARKE